MNRVNSHNDCHDDSTINIDIVIIIIIKGLVLINYVTLHWSWLVLVSERVNHFGM